MAEVSYFAEPQQKKGESIIYRINRKNRELSIELGIIKPSEMREKEEFEEVVRELYSKMGKELPKKYVLESLPEPEISEDAETNLRNYADRLKQLGY